MVPRLPHKVGESLTLEELYYYDIFAVLVNIAGLPAISVPFGSIEGCDFGLQIITPKFHEDTMYTLAKEFEKYVTQ